MPKIIDKKTGTRRLRKYSELTPAMRKKYPTSASYKKYTNAYKT